MKLQGSLPWDCGDGGGQAWSRELCGRTDLQRGFGKASRGAVPNRLPRRPRECSHAFQEASLRGGRSRSTGVRGGRWPCDLSCGAVCVHPEAPGTARSGADGHARCGNRKPRPEREAAIPRGRLLGERAGPAGGGATRASLKLDFRQERQAWSVWRNVAAAAAAKSLQSCPTLCDPIDGSPPGSPIPGILQARTLQWAAISFSNA